MRTRPKTQRAFLACTTVTVIAITTVFLVYAIVLSTITGGPVSVVSSEGLISYNQNNSTNPSDWTSTLSNVGNATPWYSKLDLTAGGPTGAVTVTWMLQRSSTGWANVTGGILTSGITLTGSAQTVYASTDGDQTLNNNWGALCTEADSYRIKVVITQP